MAPPDWHHGPFETKIARREVLLMPARGRMLREHRIGSRTPTRELLVHAARRTADTPDAGSQNGSVTTIAVDGAYLIVERVRRGTAICRITL